MAGDPSAQTRPDLYLQLNFFFNLFSRPVTFMALAREIQSRDKGPAESVRWGRQPHSAPEVLKEFSGRERWVGGCTPLPGDYVGVRSWGGEGPAREVPQGEPDT